MVVWGVVLWVLQKAWRLLTQGFDVEFITALSYSWGALLEKPPADPSVNISGQVCEQDKDIALYQGQVGQCALVK